MNTRKLNRIWLAALALMLASVACLGDGGTPTVTPPNNNNSRDRKGEPDRLHGADLRAILTGTGVLPRDTWARER